MKEIKAKKTSVDGIVFDSALEAKAYRLLCMTYGRDKVICQSVLKLSGKHLDHYLPSVLHKVDFLVYTPKGQVYLEIKGQLQGKWNGKAEYIKNLNLITELTGNSEITYILWTGNGDLCFEGKDNLYFAHSFPLTVDSVQERLIPRWTPDF